MTDGSGSVVFDFCDFDAFRTGLKGATSDIVDICDSSGFGVDIEAGFGGA